MHLKKYYVLMDSWLALHEVVLDGWAGKGRGLKPGQ